MEIMKIESPGAENLEDVKIGGYSTFTLLSMAQNPETETPSLSYADYHRSMSSEDGFTVQQKTAISNILINQDLDSEVRVSFLSLAVIFSDAERTVRFSDSMQRAIGAVASSGQLQLFDAA